MVDSFQNRSVTEIPLFVQLLNLPSMEIEPKRENTDTTLGPAYNEFGYSEYPTTTSRFLCIKIIDCSVKKLGYSEHPLVIVFYIFLLVVSGTQWI